MVATRSLSVPVSANSSWKALRNAYQQLFGDSGTLSERVDDIAERFGDVKPVRDIIDFIRADSSRAICQPGERPKANGG